MRHVLGILAVVVMVLGLASPALPDERADWGVVVVGTEAGDPAMLMENDRGYQLVVVDASATLVGHGLGPMTLTDIRPGDRVDYAVATWAGMDVADVLFVTPRRQAEARY